MKLLSSSRSFALFALSFVNLDSAHTLSIDSKAGKLEPRLDGYAAATSTSSTTSIVSSSRRRKKRYSGTGTAVVSGTYPTGSGLSPPLQNATTLAISMPYPRSSSVASGIENTPINATAASDCGRSTVTVTNEHTITVTAGSGGSTLSSTSESIPAIGSTAVAASSSIYANTSAPTTVAPQSLPVSSNVMFGQNSTGKAAGTSSTSAYDAITAPDGASSAATSTPTSGATPTVLAASNSATNTGFSANQTLGTPYDHNGEFWAGAGIDTLLRAEALPGRTFYDYDGKTVKDPIKTLGDAGVNAFRVQAFRDMCLGPEPFVNNASSLADELLFKLNFGCISTKVEIAKQAIAAGMRMQLTINQGFNIPKGMEKYTYAQMVEEVQKETKRQLQPFLDAKIVPDIILFENEGSDGFLFHEEATGHDRGHNDNKVSSDVLDQELCGQIPTGLLNSYPQAAGYWKAEVIACNEAIKTAGFPVGSVRYGLHSHGQYVQWKEAVVHGPDRASQTQLKKHDGSPCDGSTPIPSDLLAMDVAEALTIAGFSAYPDPGRPTDINSSSSLRTSLDRLNATLTQIQGYSETFGRYTDGPFKGQYKLQAFGVEYASVFKYPNEMKQQQQHTSMMFDLVKSFPNFLGLLWYEPWYCVGDWEGGDAALCRKSFRGGDIIGESPTDTLKTWGAAAVSPWKKTSA
ncbi:MAG: hypothetical protein Q9170_002750 [Blastenia crenularia]